jgi:hypothetical protein
MAVELTDSHTHRLRTFQWTVVAGWIVMFAASLTLGSTGGPAGYEKGIGCATGLLTALAHGIWITLDARIKDREVSAWRFGAFFLGPLVLWIWFFVVYGPKKALLLIPISIVVYFIPIAQVLAAAALGLVTLEG